MVDRNSKTRDDGNSEGDEGEEEVDSEPLYEREEYLRGEHPSVNGLCSARYKHP